MSMDQLRVSFGEGNKKITQHYGG